MSPGIGAGQLRHRVELQSDTAPADSMGGESAAGWTTTATVWADVQPLSGAERVASQAPTSTTQYRVYLRYRSDVTTRMRLLWDAIGLQIQSVIRVDGQKYFLVLDCTAVT